MKKCDKISLLLIFTFLLVFSSIPTLAATTARIGNSSYGTFDKALFAAGNGQTVKLVRNAVHTVDGYYAHPSVEKKKVTIDLNGKKLTLKESVEIRNKATVIFKNGTIASSNNGIKNIYCEEDSTLKFVNCKINNIYLDIKYDATLDMKNCNLNAKDIGIALTKARLIINGGTYTHNCMASMFMLSGSKATINGGTFDSSRNANPYTVLFAINAAGTSTPGVSVNSTLTINGGTFKSKESVINLSEKQTCVINRGTFSSEEGSTIIAQGKLTVNGGTIHAKVPSSAWKNAYGIEVADAAVIKLKNCTVISDAYTAIGYFDSAKPKITIGSGVELKDHAVK